MPNNKVSEAQAIYVNEIRRVQETSEKWKDFLDFAAQAQISENQNEFEFSSKLIIHAENPKATDCRTFGEWKTADGNHINQGQHGIAVLSRNSKGNQSVTYLFDTSQTAMPKEPERVEIPEEIKEKLKSALSGIVEKYLDNASFSEEQKRIFKATAKYKLCKQYELETDENSENFLGIDKLSVKEIANIGVSLNRCSQSFSEIVNNERSNFYETSRSNDSKSRNDRTELHRREQRGMDLGRGRSGNSNAHEEIRFQRGNEQVEQAERETGSIRADVLGTSAEANSGNGQVRQHETKVHMADSALDRSDNAERGTGRRGGKPEQALRGDERESSEHDRENSGEEKTVGGIQGDRGIGEIPAESANTGEVQNRSGGRSSSGDGLRNITNEAAEPEKVSAASVSENKQSDPFENAKRSKNGDIILGNTTFRYIPEKTYTKIDKRIAAEVSEQLEKQSIKFSGVIKGDTATITVSKPQKETLDKIIADISSPDNDIAQTAEKQNVDTPELTDKEKAFLNGEIAPFMAKSVLAWDEIEDLGYCLYEKGYIDRHAPSEKAIYGNGLNEPVLYDMVKRMQSGEDIRKELALALLGNQHTFITNSYNEFNVEYGDDFITAKYGNAERQVSYEELSNAFFTLIENEYNDIVRDRTIEDLQDNIPKLPAETANQLIAAFDSASRPDWENNFQKQQNIKKALYDILGDEEYTQKAFDSIADMKYNVKISKSAEQLDENNSPEKISDVSENKKSDVSVQLSQSEFIEIASNLLSADKTVSNAHRYSDEQNYRTEIDNGIDRIFTEALTGERDIGYSVSEIVPLYNQFQNNGEIREYIQNIISENVDISLSSEEQRIEEMRQFAKDSGIPFSDRYSDGAEEEFNPYAYDGSMSPEDFRKMQLLNKLADITNTEDDTPYKLIEAFDGAALPDWEKGDNVPKLNRIKKALFDILGNEEQTEKAFAVIANDKYNVNFEAEKSAIQEITFLGSSNGFEALKAVTNNDSFGTTVAGGDTLTVVINDNADVNDVRRLVEAAQNNGVYLNAPSANMLEVRFGTDFMQESHKPTVSDLSVGDVILYDGKRREVEQIDENRISLKDLDAPDFGGILLGTSDIYAYAGWQEDMNEKGFEILSKGKTFSEITRDRYQTENPHVLVIKGKGSLARIDISINDELWERLAEKGLVRNENSVDRVIFNTDNRNWNKIVIPDKWGNMTNNINIEDVFTREELLTAKSVADFVIGNEDIQQVLDNFKEDIVPAEEISEIPDKITFEVFGGGSMYFRDEEMNDLAEINADGIKYYAELSENDKKKIADRANELTAKSKKANQKAEFEPDSEGEQLELFHIEENRPYQVITYDSDSGADDKEDYVTLKEAQKSAKEYLKDGYEGYAVYNTDTQTIEETSGYFPSERIFSFDVLLKNGVITPEQEPEMIKKFMEEEIHDKVLTELLNSEDLKTAARNNTREDFAFPYYEAVDNALIEMLDNNPRYAAQKEITYLLNDEEYLHNVFGDYDTIFKQLAPEKTNTEVTQEQPTVSSERVTVTQPKEKTIPKISEAEEPVRADLLNALLDNRNDIPSGKSMDFNGSGYQITYNDRARMLESELKNKSISVPEAINVMQLIGFQFDEDKIIFQRPDTSKIHNAFDKFRENHSELSDYTRKFLERAEIIMANRFMDNFNDVVSNSVMTFSYGQPDKINNNVFNGKLDEVTKEINDYLNGDERITMIHSEQKYNTEKPHEQSIPVTETSETGKSSVQQVKSSIGTVIDNDNRTASEKSKNTSSQSHYFRITDEHLGEGSKKEKFRNNIEAIKTLQILESEERAATPEEQETLSKYIGWGGLQEAFDDRIPSWNAEYYELKNMLTEEEYEAARSTVNDAFYTSPVITQAIYEGLENIGFKGGEVLEPSMGIGNFFGTMPDNMRENSNLSGVEIDSISGRIAQKLYPEANIAINGFEKVKPSKGTFDLAVGNVPFGNHGVNDKTKAYSGLMIHDYFFAKSLDSVRSGGIVAFVTSTGTLDKEDIKVRQMLAQKAELMGAVRLPNNAFQKNAGTQTATDIIFLKKREKPLTIGEMPMDKSCDWVHTKENADGLKINSYFADNPEMVLGTLSDSGRFGSIVCSPIQGADLKEQLHEAMKNIKGEYTPLEFQQELDERAEDKYLTATPDIENLTYTVVDNKLYFRVDDNLIPLKESEQHGVTAERRKAMCGLGETVRELLQAQVEDRPDKEIKLLQAELNVKYDNFVKKYGRINPVETPNPRNASGVTRKATNSNAFKNDVRLPLLQSLEKMKEGQFVGKTEIFTERTIRPRKVAEHVETSQEALILSVSEKGKLDFDYMEKLTGFEKEKIISDLKGDIYPVPELSTEDNTVYQTSDEYLSGNIYKKIAAAEAKLSENPAYAENITALTEVIPTPLKATEIDMQLGMTWIDTKIIQQFMYETFETPQRFKEYDESILQKNPSAITVQYSGAGKGSWKVENARLDNSVKSTKNFGTKDFNAYELLEKILNAKSVAVTQVVRDDEGRQKTIILEKETKAEEDKVKQINAAFKKWIFADPERRNELVKTYNEKFNCIRPREYDGSNLNFFGSNPEITLKPHQKNAIAHALFGGNTLFAHQVGAGKTFEMIATAMEGKRLGLHNKSMFVVPNHLTEQIGSDFMKLYPNANILVAKPDDFSPQKRRQMCARIATGNFDAVIIGHSQLIKIPLSPKREEAFIRNQIDEVVAALEAAQETDSKSYTVKQLEATRKNLRERLEKLTNGTVKDNAVTFEELGVDKLFVDEAHEFKNLYVSTKMENVSGLSTNADVQKTQDLYMKCQYLDEKTGSKGIVFSTGTPVTNALSEMFTMQKYLQSDLLKETGLESFDAWAGNFTRKSTEAEISPSGSDWKMKTRLKFTNVPELVTMFKECADIKMADQLNLDVPECEKHIVSVEPTESQKAVVQSLAVRAEKISHGEVSRTEDNMLVVTGDGRKLGLDQRLYDLNLPDEPQTKLNACIQNVFDIWEKTSDKKSTQLIFCDLGVPQSKEDFKKNGERFDVYSDIRSKLIEKGVPEKEIAFIHEANSETEKAKLFAKVRSGDVRVLIGSTQKMGAGTNVQDKLVALHDLDCPWRPADLTQRLGRMVRQGNENDKVDNYRYVTKGTFDAYLYQMVEKKQESIAQIFTSKAIARTCDDIDDMAVDFMQVKMAAVGDDRIRRQMELREDIRSLNMLKNTYLENKYEIEDNIKSLPTKIAYTEKLIEGIAADTKMIKGYVPKKDIDGKEIFEIKIGNTVYTDKKEAAEALKAAMTNAVIGNPKTQTDIAEYKGFKIAVSYDSFSKTYKGHIKAANSYPFDFGSSESGNLTRIDNVIASVPMRIDRVCNELERIKTELADSQKEVNQPFEHEAELEEKKQELERLTDEINADKVKGEIAPEQPESTEKTAERAEHQEQSEKPTNLNIKWRQNDKELRITYDSTADNKITAYSDGKEIGHCSPDELTVTKISESEQKKYPDGITKCVEPLNLAFSSKMAMHIRDFAQKVKAAADKPVSRDNKALFSRDRIMSDDFKPTSEKTSDTPKQQEH